MSLIFDMTDEEKDIETNKRIDRINASLTGTEQIERWLESQGGTFIGVNEGKINFGFDNKAFEDLCDKLFNGGKK